MAAPARPPATIEDFLWNLHSVLVATPAPLHLDKLKETYSNHLGHKCAIERFLVVGEGGLAATLKRIPHMVTLFQDGGVACVKATNPATATREDLIEVDKSYRQELMKKNQAAKAKAAAAAAGAKAKPAVAAPAPAPAKAATPAPAADPTSGDKRPAVDAAGADAKKPKAAPAAGAAGAENDTETLARMLVQGVVRVLQNRAKAGKGPLPIAELEDEFKALWKVPFNLQQAGESDPVTFFKKWGHKVELQHDSEGNPMVALKKAGEKAKAGGAPAKAEAAPAPAATAPSAAKTAPVATAAKSSPATTTASPISTIHSSSIPAIPKRAAGPSRPPATIEEFLYNIHTVIESASGPLPVDQLKEAYSKHLGHKCAIERFLVVGEGGIIATLKRIPHIVTITPKDGQQLLTATQPVGTTKENLISVDQAYRRQLQAKNAAAKGSPPAKAPQTAGAPTGTPVSTAPATTAAKATPAAVPPALAPVPKRAPQEEVAAADAKKPKPSDDQETLSKMLIQGIVRVLQNRAKEGKGPLPVTQIEDEFLALWKVPFNLAQAGESDKLAFLQKWPNKVEVASDGTQHVVQLSKKSVVKAPAPAVAAAPEPAKATPTATAAPSAAKSAPSAPKVASVVSETTVSNGTATDGSTKSLDEIQRAATEQLQQMRDMLRRQEDLVNAIKGLRA